MYRIKILISIFIFSILLGFTSVIKTKTRVIEKKIFKVESSINVIEKDLHETQLDYSYLSSPSFLAKKIKDLAFIEYEPMDFSRIFLSYNDFVNNQNKISNLNIINEKKK
tara:strand:+ start:203 stop:532 length:330 start_codon:yes stop_codon:yes gene_type:complete